MKSISQKRLGPVLATAARSTLFVTALIATMPLAYSIPNVILWDSVSPLADTTAPEDSSAWKAVPSDLLTLEREPAKASSDPGYYGREYMFQGDAIVENEKLVALFCRAKGAVGIYTKERSKRFGTKIAELAPLPADLAASISRVRIVRNGADEVVLETFLSNGGAAESGSVFTFGKNEIVDVKPAQGLKGMRIRTSMEHGILPGLIGDDLQHSAKDYPASRTLCLPAEQLFLGLLEGENSELVMTWPKGKQQIRLRSGNANGGKPLLDAIEFENDGQSFYLAGMSRPGIWHKEALAANYLEKDVASTWTRPFPAKWKTQLFEEGLKTSFAFRETKGQIWRGVPGSYEYPVWFDEDRASFHLSKKVPPKGEALVYFIEGQNTPAEIATPVDILRATLGRSASESIVDVPGRKLRTHHRRGGDGVRRACTCGCTEAIQTFFEKGEEVARKEEIKQELDDMIYFVHRHVERIDEYRHFADELQSFLTEKSKSSLALKPYADGLIQIAGRIGEEYKIQQENMKSFSYADDLTQLTLRLCSHKDPANLKSYMELLKAWRGMGGAQDYVLAQCHTITRKLCQEAGYACAELPEAAPVAAEIRARCRQCLRNPDGYEIWADY